MKHTNIILAAGVLCLAMTPRTVLAENQLTKHVVESPKVTVTTGHHYGQRDYQEIEETTRQHLPTTARIKYNDWTVGAMYSGKQSSFRYGDSARITTYVAKDLNKDWSMQVFGTTGLADKDSDSTGVMFRRKLKWLHK